MNNKKQTSVQWLWDEINKRKCWTDPIQCANLFGQTKELEYKQQMDAFYEGQDGRYTFDQYINETYGEKL